MKKETILRLQNEALRNENIEHCQQQVSFQKAMSLLEKVESKTSSHRNELFTPSFKVRTLPLILSPLSFKNTLFTTKTKPMKIMLQRFFFLMKSYGYNYFTTKNNSRLYRTLSCCPISKGKKLLSIIKQNLVFFYHRIIYECKKCESISP